MYLRYRATGVPAPRIAGKRAKRQSARMLALSYWRGGTSRQRAKR